MLLEGEALLCAKKFKDTYFHGIILGRTADLVRRIGKQRAALSLLQSKVLQIFNETEENTPARAKANLAIAATLSMQGKNEEALSILKKEVLPIFWKDNNKAAYLNALMEETKILMRQGKLK